MNQGTSGVIAIVIFAILLFLFITALATAPANQITSSGAGTPFVLPVATTAGIPAAVTAGGSGQVASAVTVYTVQSGEWLQVIAERYNTTVNAILALNPQITQPSAIRPGQQITIPVSNVAP